MIHNLSTRNSPSKRIVVIGAGAAGLVAIKTLRSTPEFARGEWEILCFERRHALGGIWLPEPEPPTPPALPQTPLYPSLTTNPPHPIMAYRDFLFPPSTPLYPPASTVLAYLEGYAKGFGLMEYIQFNTEVESTEFDVRRTHGDDPNQEATGGSQSRWTITTRDINTSSTLCHMDVDTLILANGRHNLPHFPHSTALTSQPDRHSQLPGLGQWLECQRASHAMYYRTPPAHYHGRTVLVVGDGPSARDIAPEIASVAKMVWRSVRFHANPAPETGGLQDQTSSPKENDLPIQFCGPVTSLGPPPVTTNGISDNSLSDIRPNVFLANGQSLAVDYIVFGTGYELSFPFLSEAILDRHNSNERQVSNGSTTAGAQEGNKPLSLYPLSLSPLLQHLLPSSPLLPLGSLFVLGLPRPVIPFPLDEAQCRLLTVTLQGGGQLRRILQQPSSTQGSSCGGSSDPRTATQNAEELSRRYHLFEFSGDQFDYREVLTLLSMTTTDEEKARMEIERMVPVWHRMVYDKKVDLRTVWRDLERRGMAEEVLRDVGKGEDAEEEWVGLMERLLQEKVRFLTVVVYFRQLTILHAYLHTLHYIRRKA